MTAKPYETAARDACERLASELDRLFCPICAALDEIPHVQAGTYCTLHGGLMTATEVKMRHTHVVEGNPPTWVERGKP